MDPSERPGEEEVTRSDIEAVAATRAELGAAYEPDLLEAFADRVEHTIDERVERRLRARDREQALASRGGKQQLALGIVSVVACIPLVLALGLNGAMAPLVISLLAIAAINAAHASAVNGPRRPG